MSAAPAPKAPHLAEAKPLTFLDHVVNIWPSGHQGAEKHPG